MPVTVLSTGATAAACAYVPGKTITVDATNPQCNYTISWSASFNGVISLTYNTGSGVSPASAQQISIPFINVSSIVGDPQFVGLRGQQYQVHGIDGAVYNLISERSTQVNARFAFLTQGSCPVIGGVADSNCWSHPGSYLAELSFQQVGGRPAARRAAHRRLCQEGLRQRAGGRPAGAGGRHRLIRLLLAERDVVSRGGGED